MLSPRRQDPATATTGDLFTFSNPNLSDPDLSKGAEYERWAERIKGKYNYFGRLEDVKYGAWTRRTTKNESDTPSPELWQAGRPPVRSAESSPVRNSPARYRQEMLDLVKDVPETAYELSLIDMVESTKITRADDTSKKKKKERKGKKWAKSTSRSESMETGGGLMLKMFTPRAPAGLGCRRHSFNVNSGTCAKVSPTRPGAGDGEKGGVERRMKEEWWSCNSSGASSSNSSGSTNSSSSSSSSISSRIIGSCYPFIAHKGKSMERED